MFQIHIVQIETLKTHYCNDYFVVSILVENVAINNIYKRSTAKQLTCIAIKYHNLMVQQGIRFVKRKIKDIK